jgi:hypothetical protein
MRHTPTGLEDCVSEDTIFENQQTPIADEVGNSRKFIGAVDGTGLSRIEEEDSSWWSMSASHHRLTPEVL